MIKHAPENLQIRVFKQRNKKVLRGAIGETMKKIVILLILTAGLVTLLSALPSVDFTQLSYGDDTTLEIMTWNLEHFPKHGEDTIDLVAGVILAIQPDILAMQEIKSDSAFVALVARLQAQDAQHTWSGFKANSDTWHQDLAFVYKSSEVTISSINEIYRNDELYHGPFPRSPLVMEATWKGLDLVLINNHYKARGGRENEARRAKASRLIDQYITANYDRANVVMMGDLNDEITDDAKTNVFLPFLDKPDEYRFADMSIAADSTAHWSYPYWKYRGHIDHILISNELFDEFQQDASGVKTVVIDAVMEGGDDARYRYISDHRPVVLKLAVPTN